LNELTDRLPPDEVAAAQQRGQVLSLEEAIALARLYLN
jgi:hypothetical protein